VRKVAAGAAESVPFIAVVNLARTLRDLKERGIWLIGTSDRPRPRCSTRISPAPWPSSWG
jgi:tRNA G18 (ribose-2'-O)-methylase SpoU